MFTVDKKIHSFDCRHHHRPNHYHKLQKDQHRFNLRTKAEAGPSGPEGSPSLCRIHKDLLKCLPAAGGHRSTAGVGGYVPLDWQVIYTCI